MIVLATLLWYIVVKLGIWGNKKSWGRSTMVDVRRSTIRTCVGVPVAALAIGLPCDVLENDPPKNGRNHEKLIHLRNLLRNRFTSLLALLKLFFKLASMVCLKLLPQHALALFPMCWLYPFEFGASLPVVGHIPISVDLIWLVHALVR